MGMVMEYLSEQPKLQIFFLLTWLMGQTVNMVAAARSEYIPLLSRLPLTQDERGALLLLYNFLHPLPVSFLTIGILSNVVEVQGFLRRRLGSLLLGCQCFLLMAISAVQLVATPPDSFAIALLFLDLVNSAIASSILILSSPGHLCPAALKAFSPAMFIDKVYMAITGHAKKE